MKKMLTGSEVAEILHVAERTVHRWVRDGKLKAYRPGRRLLCSEEQVLELLGDPINPEDSMYPENLRLYQERVRKALEAREEVIPTGRLP